MATIQCNICHENFPIDQFFFSPCGHGYCESCTRSLEKTRTCPSCRTNRIKAQLHKIFVTPAEPSVGVQAQSLTQSMKKLRPNSSPSSAEEVVKGIRNISGKPRLDKKTADDLLEVAKDMQERLLPIYFQMRLEQDEKRALQEKVNSWHPRITQVDAMAAEVARLKKELERGKCENKGLTARLEAEKKENEKLRRDVVDERRLTKEKESFVQKLAEEKENATKQARVAKLKLKALTRSSSSKQRRTSNSTVDDSLIVEPPKASLHRSTRPS